MLTRHTRRYTMRRIDEFIHRVGAGSQLEFPEAEDVDVRVTFHRFRRAQETQKGRKEKNSLLTWVGESHRTQASLGRDNVHGKPSNSLDFHRHLIADPELTHTFGRPGEEHIPGLQGHEAGDV